MQKIYELDKVFSSGETQLKLIRSFWACHTHPVKEQGSGHLHYIQSRDAFTMMIVSDLV